MITASLTDEVSCVAALSDFSLGYNFSTKVKSDISNHRLRVSNFCFIVLSHLQKINNDEIVFHKFHEKDFGKTLC